MAKVGTSNSDRTISLRLQCVVKKHNYINNSTSSTLRLCDKCAQGTGVTGQVALIIQDVSSLVSVNVAPSSHRKPTLSAHQVTVVLRHTVRQAQYWYESNQKDATI